MKIIFFIDLMLEIAKYLLAGYAFLKQKVARHAYIGALIAVIGVICVWAVAGDAGGAVVLMVPVLFTVIMITFDLSIKDKIIFSFQLFFIVSCIDYAMERLINIVFSFRTADEVGWLINNVFFVILYAVIGGIQKRRKRNIIRNRTIRSIILYASIVLMAISMMLTISSLSYYVEKVKDSSIVMMEALSSISALGIVLLILFMIYIIDVNKEMNEFLNQELFLKENQQNYYEAMLQKEEETRRFRHDISDHIMCLMELAERDGAQNVKRYVDKMQEDMVVIQKQCYSVGNTVLDVILNYYLQQLPQDVNTMVSGYLIRQTAISEMELCTVFSNLLRNSVEELMKPLHSGRYLKIQVYERREDFTIEVINSAQTCKKKGAGGLPKTNKKDVKNHGIGLRNIKETVEKNHGIFEWESTCDEFRVKVTLPVEENDKSEK